MMGSIQVMMSHSQRLLVGQRWLALSVRFENKIEKLKEELRSVSWCSFFLGFQSCCSNESQKRVLELS